MTPFPNGTGPANADTGPPAPHAAAGTGGTSAIGGAHGRPCLSGAAFRRFTLPALLGVLLLAAPLHAAYGTESGTPPSGDMEWKGEASTPSKRCPTLPFDGELTLGAGGSVSSSPYKGYGPDWLPFPMITYEGERFFIRGYTAGVKIINLASNLGSLCSALLAGTVVVGVGLVSAAASILGHYLGAGLAIKNGSRIVRPTVILVLILLLVKVVSELLFPEFWS